MPYINMSIYAFLWLFVFFRVTSFYCKTAQNDDIFHIGIELKILEVYYNME